MKIKMLIVVALGVMAVFVGHCGPEEPGVPMDALSDVSAPMDSGGVAEVAEDLEQAPDTVVAPDLSDELFAQDTLLEVQITLAPADWEALRHQTRTFVDLLLGDCLAAPFAKVFTYFPATVVVNGQERTNVGLRKKGLIGSLSTTKPSLKIKFDAYEDGQELSSMSRLTLNNSRQDPSYMNTCLTYKVFRDAGYPAPRCSFAHVTVNGTDLGVYIHVDSIKKPYIRRHFASDEGNLYEGTLSDFNTTFRGTFEKKTHKEENDFSDIDMAMAALSTGGATGLALVEGAFDIDRFLTFWTVEVLVAHWDGYNGNLNNFYLYVDPAINKFVFLPWGPDSAFHSLDHPFDDYNYDPSVLANSTLGRRLYDDPTHRAAYHERMKLILDTAWNEEGLLEEVARIRTLIQPNIPAENITAFETAADIKETFIKGQRSAILAGIALSPEFTNPPPGSPCYTTKGAVQLTFETTWESLDFGEGWKHGEVHFSEFSVGEEAVSPAQSGCVMGVETEGPAAGQTVLSVVNLMADGNLDMLAFVVDPTLLESNVTLAIDGQTVSGYVLRLSPPYTGQFEILGTMAAGTLTLDTFSNQAGDLVTGTIQASIF